MAQRVGVSARAVLMRLATNTERCEVARDHVMLNCLLVPHAPVAVSPGKGPLVCLVCKVDHGTDEKKRSALCHLTAA